MLRKSSLAGLAVLGVVLAGCAQPPVPEDHFYRLTVAPPKTHSGQPLFRGNVEVGRFVADGVVAGRAIAYSRPAQPQELQVYHYHFWTEPPPIMLQSQLVAFLRASGVADRVVTPELRVEPKYEVSGRIGRFEQVVGSPGRVAVEIELGLKEVATDRLIQLKTYSAETATSGAAPGSAVAAFSQSVDTVFSRFLADIAKP